MFVTILGARMATLANSLEKNDKRVAAFDGSLGKMSRRAGGAGAEEEKD